MKKRTGFTLLECLVVLSIWSLLLLLTVPLFFKHINHIQEKQFFQTFKNDVLYTQSLAISSYKNPVRINIKKNQYEILKGRDNEVLSVQEIPPDWDINMRNIKDISFTKNGTIRESGTISITTRTSTYQIIFPPGKGRCYIVQQ